MEQVGLSLELIVGSGLSVARGADGAGWLRLIQTALESCLKKGTTNQIMTVTFACTWPAYNLLRHFRIPHLPPDMMQTSGPVPRVNFITFANTSFLPNASRHLHKSSVSY